MYIDYFGLKTSPFSISPDPDFLFLSPHHQEALAHLIFGMKDQGGFIVLTGEVGTGKTTLIRTLLERRDSQVNIALILNPRLNELDFIETICDELKISYPEHSSLKYLNDKLNAYLLEQFAENHFVVVILDEAQHLSDELLERIRLLTNLETNKHRLLKVILVGQPELKITLEKQELRQVTQRITGRYHLLPLSAAQTQVYIYHRLAIAGCTRPVFSETTFDIIYKYTQGIPRLINVLCDRSLLGAYTENAHQVAKLHVIKAADELFLLAKPQKKNKPLLNIVLAIILIIFIVLLGFSGAYLFKSLNNNGEQNLNNSTQRLTLEPNTQTVQQVSNQQITKHDDQPKLEEKAVVNQNAVEVKTDSKDQLESNVKEADKGIAKDRSDAMVKQAHKKELVDNIDELRGKILAKGNNLEPFWKNLALWEVAEAPNPALERCDAIYKNSGLSCYSSTLDFEQIQKINLPSLLLLKTNEGSRELLLRSIQGEKIIIDSESQEIISHSSALSRVLKELWKNEVIIIWRPPFGRTQLGPGEQGSAVELMIKQLSLANKQEFKQKKNYDGEVFEAIKTFQKQNNLIPDGVASSQTLLYLNQWTELKLIHNEKN